MPKNSNSKSIINQKNCEKYTWGTKCFGWYYLNDSRWSIIREEMPPHTSEIVHYHEIVQQFFYILEGRATIEIDDQVLNINKGEGIHIHPKQIHCIKNNTSSKIEFLVISEPHSQNDRIQLTH